MNTLNLNDCISKRNRRKKIGTSKVCHIKCIFDLCIFANTQIYHIYLYVCLHIYTFKNINPIQKYYIKAFCFDLILAQYQEVILLHLIIVALLADFLLCKLNTALGFYSIFFVVCASFD